MTLYLVNLEMSVSQAKLVQRILQRYENNNTLMRKSDAVNLSDVLDDLHKKLNVVSNSQISHKNTVADYTKQYDSLMKGDYLRDEESNRPKRVYPKTDI